MMVSFGVMGKFCARAGCGIVKLTALSEQSICSAWNLPGGLA